MVVVLTSVGQLLAPLAKIVVEIVATPTSMPTPRTNMAEHEVAADLFPFFEQVVDSSGAKTLIEMKRPPLNSAHLNQVIGNSVTYSFVHKNRHPTQNTLVPVVGISGSTGKLLMAAYDCARDVLIYTQPHPWFNTRTAAFVEDGLLLLWLCLHHRIFLKELSGSKPCSGYMGGLGGMGS